MFYLVVPCQCCYITVVLVIPVLFKEIVMLLLGPNDST
jgi:hypothetical protein